MATHYHIRWSSKEALDWEAFNNRTEAEESANQLVRTGESYSIEERDESCPRCWKEFTLNAPSPNPRKTYPWQQAVFDAFSERDPKKACEQIARAEIAIRKRLLEVSRSTANGEELRAIQDSLRALESLFSDPEQKKESA